MPFDETRPGRDAGYVTNATSEQIKADTRRVYACVRIRGMYFTESGPSHGHKAVSNSREEIA